MLFRVIFTVCCKKNTEQTNTLCGGKVEFVGDKAGRWCDAMWCNVMCVVTTVFRGLKLAMYYSRSYRSPLNYYRQRTAAPSLEKLRHFLSPEKSSVHCWKIPHGKINMSWTGTRRLISGRPGRSDGRTAVDGQTVTCERTHVPKAFITVKMPYSLTVQVWM
jgi:hypothetical protein